ncbi:hypothetical protein COEREDRAFT_5459 [Coemansia reversa NRRL 1564]|uniref:Uncharacterized protein n=1 Tax=Coemansia reversa (strain ATCC 12441 / NRRL 1564) TaxID=763665 RepID=A0A2G5BKV2_COERN|nr:hypothetical protein COEREDRAFT_5459 [Coemansia reversa NRRL 1564]|eukprot:PIA19639.1 hypothetical protein COEREDRAFT_5459 [Coemansia reversa NRRL 1564]
MQSVAHMKDHERASMERELVWLLEQSIPESISHITQHLSEISIIKDTPNKGSTKQSLQAGLTANKNADISGTATVSGAVVTQLSLTLPPSYSQPAQEAAVSVYLKKGDVLPLRQAQEAQSYIKSALSKAQTAHMFGSNEEAVNVVERLLRDIQKARRILTADGCQDLMPLQSDNSEVKYNWI